MWRDENAQHSIRPAANQSWICRHEPFITCWCEGIRGPVIPDRAPSMPRMGVAPARKDTSPLTVPWHAVNSRANSSRASSCSRLRCYCRYFLPVQVNVGLQRGIISPRLFAALIMVVVITILRASSIFEWLVGRWNERTGSSWISERWFPDPAHRVRCAVPASRSQRSRRKMAPNM